jgi:hypothetical protein
MSIRGKKPIESWAWTDNPSADMTGAYAGSTLVLSLLYVFGGKFISRIRVPGSGRGCSSSSPYVQSNLGSGIGVNRERRSGLFGIPLPQQHRHSPTAVQPPSLAVYNSRSFPNTSLVDNESCSLKTKLFSKSLAAESLYLVQLVR